MTVSSEVKRADYAGNASTTDFATVFRFLQNSDVRVILTVDTTGVETPQVETTNYTLAGADLDAGGTVTMLVAPPVGTTLTIKRDVTLTQGTDYVENDEFPAESHEDALDKLTMITQQLQEELDRGIKFAEAESTASPLLPALVALKFLRVKSDLSGIELVDGTTSATASDVVNVPAGGIAATDVQAAINELDTEKQPIDATLTALAALAVAADELIYATGADAFATSSLTAFARTLLDDANAGAARTTLGLGTASVEDVGVADGDIPQMDATGYPAADGSQITGITATNLPTGFTSSNQTITSAGLLTLAHGLGASPELIQLRLKCLTAEFNYSIGDEVIINNNENDNGTTTNTGVSVVVDATNLVIRFGSNANVYIVQNKTTGAAAFLTNANWALIAKAWV